MGNTLTAEEVLAKINEIFSKYDKGEKIIRDTGLVRSRKECEQALAIIANRDMSTENEILINSGKKMALSWMLCRNDEI